METINIAAYKFVSIPNPEAFLTRILDRCTALALRGNVLIANEGINLFLAADRESIDAMISYLRTDELFGGRFSDLEVKESLCQGQPFRRMVVRIAKEIITMRHPMISPESGRAMAVDAQTLKGWLDQGHDDEGREVILLDTRNEFEVKIGTFEGAMALGIERFSEFPAAVSTAFGDNQDKTIVSFCTGGIRCEKAALYMKELGLKNVYQLEGGILRYFEDVGGDHWNGDCFVFDERVAVDPRLQETTKDYGLSHIKSLRSTSK